MVNYTFLRCVTKDKLEELIPLIKGVTLSDAVFLKANNIHIRNIDDYVKGVLSNIAVAVTASVNGKIVGVITVTVDDPYLVNALFVIHEHRRKGIAVKLMQTLTAFTKKNYKVNVVTGNEPAKAFYKSLGMKEVSTLMMIHD